MSYRLIAASCVLMLLASAAVAGSCIISGDTSRDAAVAVPSATDAALDAGSPVSDRSPAIDSFDSVIFDEGLSDPGKLNSMDPTGFFLIVR